MNWLIPEIHPLRSVPAKLLSIIAERPHYLRWNVKEFTYHDGSFHLPGRWHPFCRSSSLKRAPHRTVRRVHVMPWATPIRRIGCTRVEFHSQESDDPAGFGRRRG